MKIKKNKEKFLALSQVFILIVGMIAISYAFGSGIEIVTGSDIVQKKIGSCKVGASCVREHECRGIGNYPKDTWTWCSLDGGKTDAGVCCHENDQGRNVDGCKAGADCVKVQECPHIGTYDKKDWGWCNLQGDTKYSGVCCSKADQEKCKPSEECVFRHKCHIPDKSKLAKCGDLNLKVCCPILTQNEKGDEISNTGGKPVTDKKTGDEKKECILGDKCVFPIACKSDKDSLMKCGLGELQVCCPTEELKPGFTPPDKDEKKKVSLLGMGDVFVSPTVAAILDGAKWAGIAYLAITMVGPLLGLEKELISAASIAVSTGLFVGKTLESLGVKKVTSTLAGVGVGILMFMLAYNKREHRTFSFTCYPWDAPTGGKECDQCNDKNNLLPCSEYQCRSLGQACELLNKGTGQERCAWVNPRDVNPPIIKPLEKALLKNHQYTPNTAISPPDRGVKIVDETTEDGCVKAFTPLSFGIELDEPGKCKIDLLRKENFDDMSFYLSGGILLKEHKYVMSLPGPDALESENITLENDGKFGLYIRCQDANGNHNPANFVMTFCVDQGPDTTPPLIKETNPLNGNPVAYNQTEINVTVFVNEPATCRWSHLDQDYNNMESVMNCPKIISEMNSRGLYECKTTLKGLKDRQTNIFYFRCNDTSGNVNEESYKYSLIGTQPIVIDYIKPDNNSLIKDSTTTIKVTLEAKTSEGYKEGEAICEYSDTETTEDYVRFYETNSFKHSQDLWLGPGEHTYFIRCFDLGGNIDIKKTTFNVESDSTSPIVVRAYREDSYLKIITNEPARCVYDTKFEIESCDFLFEDGTPLTELDEIYHYTDWNSQLTFYIKCQDEYGNQPAPNVCSRIIRPVEIAR